MSREQEYEAIIDNIKNNRGGGRLGYHYSININPIIADNKINEVFISPIDYKSNNQGLLNEFYDYLNRFITEFTDLGLNIGFSNIRLLDFNAPTTNFTSLELFEQHNHFYYDEYPDSIDLTKYPNVNKLSIRYFNPIEIIGLDKLTKVTKLLMLNKSTELPAEIRNMKGLNSLILGVDNINEKNCNNITNLPDFISELPIEELNICNNNLQELMPQITTIKTLKELNAGYNNISELPNNLKELINLKRLILHHNKFTKYPKITLEMPSLDELDLGESKYNGSQNKITELPKKMNSNLKSLDLSDNLIFDISPLKDLKELEYLNLNSNGILIIPEDFYLPKLKELIINENKLRTIPLWFKDIKELNISYNEFEKDIEGPYWSTNGIIKYNDNTYKDYKKAINQIMSLNDSSSINEIKKALNKYPYPGAVKRILHNLSDKLINALESNYLDT